MDSHRHTDDRRVVVTGLGAVSAAGWGVAALREAVRSGRTAIGPFDRFDHQAQRTHVAGQVPPWRPVKGRPIRWNRWSNSDRFAVFSACEATAQAGLSPPLDNEAVGVFFGSSTAGLSDTEPFFEEMVRRPGSRPRRGVLASHLISAPAETVARHLGVRGPVETVSSACASGGLAIEQALRAIRNSEVDLALAGGAECLCLTTYSGFNALRAVDERPCRPFRSDRAGISLGEGGAVLVLESLAHARARGAMPLAEILGAGSTCDANHMTAPQADGEWAANAIRLAIVDAGLEPEAIDFINAHGTGTPLNDAAESAAMQRAFGARANKIPTTATKGVVGHLLAAAGSVAAIATILGLIDREVDPTPGGGETDPALAVDLALGAPRSLPGMRAAVSVSLGFGGANAAVVFGRWDQA
ncbi:MAG: beta-ketoacyl-[acyl-carrier-protein] synthase family protein [Vicinamibacterales bacterium]